MQTQLRDDLSQRIKAYLDAHPRVTLRSLAKRSGLSTMSVSRLAQGEIAKPSFESVLAIARVVLPAPSISEFLSTHYPETLHCVAQVCDREATVVSHDDCEQILKDPITFLVFDLASMHAGITRLQVAEEFGNSGTRSLDRLIQTGILYEDSKGHISFGSRRRYVTASVEDTIAQLKIRLDTFQSDNLGTPAARLAAISESLNADGLKKMHEVVTECIDKVQQIRHDDRYKGSLPVAIGMFMNLVTGVYESHRARNEEIV